MSNCLLLFILLGSTNAAPQPDASPDPGPDADAQYGDNYGAPVISSYPSHTSPVMPSPGGRLVTAEFLIYVKYNNSLSWCMPEC